MGRPAQPGGVGVRPERHDRTVGPAVRLEPFEDLLRVVQHDRRRVQLDGAVRQHRGVVPAPALGVVDRHHVVGVEATEPGVTQDLGTYLVARRIRVAGKREFEGAIGHVAIV